MSDAGVESAGGPLVLDQSPERRAQLTQELAYGQTPPSGFTSSKFREEDVGLCLSGGGYKACLYHAGALQVLNEQGLLPSLARVASVSGGSITAARLGLVWKQLAFDKVTGVAANFDALVTDPLRRFCQSAWLSVPSVLKQAIPPYRPPAWHLADSYHDLILDRAALADLPGEGEGPRFTILSTNYETLSAVRFERERVRDWRVGEWKSPDLRLADAVAASSAFPPVLAPLVMKTGSITLFDNPAGQGDRGQPDLHMPPFTQRFKLVDGGVYDNLGLEPVWKRAGRILVSNAGNRLDYQVPKSLQMVSQLGRVISLIHRQAETNRVRSLFDLSHRGERKLAYWSLRADPRTVGSLPPCEGLEGQDLVDVMMVEVDLKPLADRAVDLLIRHGRAGALASLGRHGPDTFKPEPRSQTRAGAV